MLLLQPLGHLSRWTGSLARQHPALNQHLANRPVERITRPLQPARRLGRVEPIHGILSLDKPLGFSSMKAVAIVRRRAGGTRTGHAGTLDPLATGVLVLALGKCTRQIESLMATDKRYLTTIDLTAFTTTDDVEGERTEVPLGSAEGGAPGSRTEPPTRAEIESLLAARFTGTVMQRPPAFSAMKVGGRRAYALARKGQAPELPPRPVAIHAIDVTDYAWPLLSLDIRCGKGTYVRSIARELGQAIGTGGHCTMIRRTAVGAFTIDRAVPLDALPERITQEWLDAVGAATAAPNSAGQ
jgi:tRNA pseudouridine55 synthase